MQLLIEGGSYLRTALITVFLSSMRSNSVQLSDTETSLSTHTALEIAQLASAGIISTHVHVPHVLAAATIYLRAAFISLAWSSYCAATIRSVATIQINTVHWKGQPLHVQNTEVGDVGIMLLKFSNSISI